MQAYLFVSAIDLVVLFGHNPEQFFDELKPLVIRHIKYGVKAEVCAARTWLAFVRHKCGYTCSELHCCSDYDALRKARSC
jgi:hypothetical protein